MNLLRVDELLSSGVVGVRGMYVGGGVYVGAGTYVEVEVVGVSYTIVGDVYVGVS